MTWPHIDGSHVLGQTERVVRSQPRDRGAQLDHPERPLRPGRRVGRIKETDREEARPAQHAPEGSGAGPSRAALPVSRTLLTEPSETARAKAPGNNCWQHAASARPRRRQQDQPQPVSGKSERRRPRQVVAAYHKRPVPGSSRTSPEQ